MIFGTYICRKPLAISGSQSEYVSYQIKGGSIMEVKYNRTGPDRKALVAAIEEIIGKKAIYKKVPSWRLHG